MPDLAEQIRELEARANRFRDVIVRTNDNAHYWYKLWLGMGTEFHRGQEVLVAEIDRLRQVNGEWNGKSYLDLQHQKYLEKMNKDWVDPDSHPANRSLDNVVGGIDVPPRHPDDLIKEAE